MTPLYSDKLLVKMRQQPFAVAQNLVVPGHTLEPLFKGYQASPLFNRDVDADHWLVATPNAGSNDHPWDAAHRLARGADYSLYVEPDLLHEMPSPPETETTIGLKKHWPPTGIVSPGWHLGKGFTGFAEVRATATGEGIRIAHLDTGYWPQHDSTPRLVRRDLGYNFYEKNHNTTDPGVGGILRQPGHGTATMALLAGNTVDLTFGGQRYVGDFGGAPDAEVVPVRIGPSVIHFYTSTMAQGMDYALGPTGDPAKSDPANKCGVVTISHGGYPSECWADAANNLYDAGVVVVAASGNNIYFLVADIGTRFVVYPSAFNRVITAVGATYDKTPYITNIVGTMEGNWGPDSVMEKAVAAYTPNVAWMEFKTKSNFDMQGAGTSSSTPQVAAACALWLQLYGTKFQAGWQRVEACRLALFTSANSSYGNQAYLGNGILDVPKMLDKKLANNIQQGAGALRQSPRDTVCFPFLRTLLSAGPPGSEMERMYETEAAQIVYRSQIPELVNGHQAHATGAALPAATITRLRSVLKAEPGVSAALQARL